MQQCVCDIFLYLIVFHNYISEYEINETIKSRKNCLIGFYPHFYFKIQHYIKLLTYLINSSFESGIFPKELRLAKVIPIFKNNTYLVEPS